MEGFGVDGTDKDVDYGKVLVFIKENRLHQVGITANAVRKRLEAEGKLKDLEALKKEEEKKEEKPNRISNLFKLYSKSLLLTTTKKKPKEDEKKEGEDDKTDDDKKKDDETKPEDKTKTDKDAKKDESPKNDPSTKLSTPTKPDASPQADDDKHSETAEEEGKPDEKPKTDAIKRIGNIFRFFNRPPGKIDPAKDEKSDQDKVSEDVESPVEDDGKDESEKSSDEKARKDSKSENKDSPKDEKIAEEKPKSKESPKDEEIKSLDEKPRKDSKLENKETLNKVGKDLDVGSDNKNSPTKEQEPKSPITPEVKDTKPKQTDKDQDDEKVNEKPSDKAEDKSSKDLKNDEPKKEDKKSDVDKKKDDELLKDGEKKDTVKPETPEKTKGLNEKEDKLSPNDDSDKQKKNDKGSHIEEYIPDFDEHLDSPKQSPEVKLQDNDGKDEDAPLKKDDEIDKEKSDKKSPSKKDVDLDKDKAKDDTKSDKPSEQIQELWPLPEDEVSNDKVDDKTDKQNKDDDAKKNDQTSKNTDHLSSDKKTKDANKIDSEIAPDNKSPDATKVKGNDKKEINLIDIGDEDDKKTEALKPDASRKNSSTNKENNLISDGIKSEIDNKSLKPSNESLNDNKMATKDKMNENRKASDAKNEKITPPSNESKNKQKPEEKNLLIDFDDDEAPKDLKSSENNKDKKSEGDDLKPRKDSKELKSQLSPKDDANKINDDKANNKTATDVSKLNKDQAPAKSDTNKMPNDKTSNDTKTSLPKSTEPGEKQKPDGKNVPTANKKADPDKNKANIKDELGANKVIYKEPQEKDQHPKDVGIKTKPDRKESIVKISDKTVTINDTKKPEKSKSNDKLKVPEKGKPKEITKAASSDKIRDSPKTSSDEKLKSTEKLADPKKAKVPGTLSGKSKSSDRLGPSQSSEKIRDSNLMAKRKSLQPPAKPDAKDIIKTGRPRSISLKPDIHSNRRKSESEKKDQLKSKIQPGGRKDSKKFDKLSESDECLEKEPVDEDRIKRCRKQRRQLTSLEEVDGVLVLHTQASYTSEEDDPIEDKLGNKTDETSSKQNSTAPKSSKTNQIETKSTPNSKQNDVIKNNESGKKQPGKQPVRGGHGSDIVPSQGSKSSFGRPEKEITTSKKGVNQANDSRNSDKSNWKVHPGIKGKIPGSHRYDPLGEVSDSSLDDEWHDTKSYISSDWHDAKSHISNELSDWKAYNYNPYHPEYNRKQNPYVDPRLAYLDDVDNNRSIRNSRIPIPSRGPNSVKTGPNTPNYPEDRIIPFRSRSKSPVKTEKRPRTISEGTRKRPPMKTIINKPLRNLGPKEFSNISNLKADKNHAESLKVIRPSYLRSSSYVPPSRIQQYLKVYPNHNDLEGRMVKSEHQLPYIRLPDDRRSRNPSEDSYRSPSDISPFKRTSPSPPRAKYDHKRYSPQPSSSPYRNRLEVNDIRHTRRSHNDLADETDGSYYLDPRSLCPQNICRSRCNCLSRSADDLEDFSNSSSILKLTFVPPNRKPAWKL